MTQLNNVPVKCPHCEASGTYTHYASVNVTLDPKLKEKILDQSLFIYTCEACGASVNVDVDMLYHDMEKLLMIHFLPGEEDPVKTALEAFKVLETIHTLPNQDLYTLRVVPSVYALTDKIHAFDDDLHDGLLEAAKIAIQNHEPTLQDTSLYYTHIEVEDDQPLLAFSALIEGAWQGIRVPRSLYDAMDEAFPHVRQATAQCAGIPTQVDAAWTADAMLSKPSV